MAVTGKQYAEKADVFYQEKYGYIYGATDELWTEKKQASLEAKYNSDPVKYSSYALSASVGKKWIGKRVTDCSGLVKKAAEKLGIKNVYHGSNSQFNKNCSKTGKIEKGMKIPVGALIFTGKEAGQHNHVGVLISETCVVEAQGAKAGVVHTPISNKKWTYYGLLKGITYDDAETSEKETQTESSTSSKKKVTYPTLRRGAKGDLVYQLQRLLQEDGSTIVADGIFGLGTMSAVKSFQKRHGLVVDGIVGPKTWAELTKLG